MFYRAARWICRTVLRIVFRWRVLHAERMPGDGPVLIISNHANLVDPIIVGCCFDRKVHFMAKGELFKVPLLNGIIRALGAYPVRRGKADRAAIESSLEILATGGVMGMFPEGTRYKDGQIHPLRSGAAVLAMRSKCRILPVVIEGSNRLKLFRFPRINAYVGAAFSLPEHLAGESEKEKTKNATAVIQQRLDELWGDIPTKSHKNMLNRSSQSGVITP